MKDPIRYRETQVCPPQGRDNRAPVLTRVVETDGPIPEGCEPTTDVPHDWKESN